MINNKQNYFLYIKIKKKFVCTIKMNSIINSISLVK